VWVINVYNENKKCCVCDDAPITIIVLKENDETKHLCANCYKNHSYERKT